MIREKVDASHERNIILQAITNTEFLKEIRNIAKADLFKTPYAKTVWEWVSTYFDEFGLAPNKDIQDIYVSHKMEIDQEEEEAIATFLHSLSNQEQVNNIDYSVKRAIEWLKLRSIENLVENLQESLVRKDYEQGELSIAEFKKVEQSKSKGVSLFTDITTAVSAFNDEGETLFRFPGAFGETVGDFKRTDFVSFLGYMKTGKTHFLWETAKTAMLHCHKVLFISLEMPINQIMRRIWQSLSKRPKRDKVIRVPYFTEEDGEEELWSIAYEETEIKKFQPTKEYFEDWVKKYKTYFKGGDVRIASMPARSVTVKDIVNYIDNLEYYNNWIPDVVVIDYADLISSKIKGEYRHQLDDIWANLRRLALERNICVVTASQSGRAAARGDSSDENIAEDIRKVAHVTKMIAINATKEDKMNSVYRVSQIVERDDATNYEQCFLLSCLDLGQVCLDSRFKSEVYFKKETE